MHVLQRGSAMHKLPLTSSSIPEPRQDAFWLHAHGGRRRLPNQRCPKGEQSGLCSFPLNGQSILS
ncbi:hypothetical protein MY5147_006872 [Beauveria neobassiana]